MCPLNCLYKNDNFTNILWLDNLQQIVQKYIKLIQILLVEIIFDVYCIKAVGFFHTEYSF